MRPCLCRDSNPNIQHALPFRPHQIRAGVPHGTYFGQCEPWQREWDLNPQPSPYEGADLPLIYPASQKVFLRREGYLQPQCIVSFLFIIRSRISLNHQQQTLNCFSNARLLYLAFGQGVRNTSSNLSYSGEPNFYTGGHCSRFVPFNYLLIALKCVQRSDGVPIPFGMVLLVCSYELHLLPSIIFLGLVFAYPHFPFPKCNAPYQLGSYGQPQRRLMSLLSWTLATSMGVEPTIFGVP